MVTLSCLISRPCVLSAIMLLCMCVLTVNAEDVVVLKWTSPTEGWLTSVFMVSSGDGWVISNVGTIFRWNGAELSNWMSLTSERLLSLSIVDAPEGWAVGYGGTTIRWTGTKWVLEFSSFVVLLLLMSLASIAIMFAKRRVRIRLDLSHS